MRVLSPVNLFKIISMEDHMKTWEDSSCVKEMGNTTSTRVSG